MANIRTSALKYISPAQELSTMIRLGLNPIIFVICNEGCTIERLIHGMDEVYNDIQPWHFKELVNVFGAEEGESRTSQVKTKERTKKLFDDKEFNSATDLQFVELYMQKQDTPRALMLIAVTSARINAEQ